MMALRFISATLLLAGVFYGARMWTPRVAELPVVRPLPAFTLTDSRGRLLDHSSLAVTTVYLRRLEGQDAAPADREGRPLEEHQMDLTTAVGQEQLALAGAAHEGQTLAADRRPDEGS